MAYCVASLHHTLHKAGPEYFEARRHFRFKTLSLLHKANARRLTLSVGLGDF